MLGAPGGRGGGFPSLLWSPAARGGGSGLRQRGGAAGGRGGDLWLRCVFAPPKVSMHPVCPVVLMVFQTRNPPPGVCEGAPGRPPPLARGPSGVWGVDFMSLKYRDERILSVALYEETIKPRAVFPIIHPCGGQRAGGRGGGRRWTPVGPLIVDPLGPLPFPPFPRVTGTFWWRRRRGCTSSRSGVTASPSPASSTRQAPPPPPPPFVPRQWADASVPSAEERRHRSVPKSHAFGFPSIPR